jgi:hypothetical protein
LPSSQKRPLNSTAAATGTVVAHVRTRDGRSDQLRDLHTDAQSGEASGNAGDRGSGSADFNPKRLRRVCLELNVSISSDRAKAIEFLQTPGGPLNFSGKPWVLPRKNTPRWEFSVSKC